MQHLPIIKALSRAAIAADSRDVAVHQLGRLVSALRKEGDGDAEALEKLIVAASSPGRSAPTRAMRSSVANLERMKPGVPVPVDPDSAAPLATLVFPEDNVAQAPVFSAEVEAVVRSLTREWEHQEELFAAGLRPSLTALIYGPPGTGKTTLALWLARELQLPAVIARLDGLISSLLGTTARNLGALFDFVNRYDCVLILDEFDAIAKVRDDPNEVGEIKRVVNALLQNLDGRARTGITVGLTNHETLLDPAVWRRFEVQVPIPMPELEERSAIVSGALSHAPVQASEAKLIAWLTKGMSGAEVTTVCDKWQKRKIIDAKADVAPVEIVLQAVRTTAARFGTIDIGRYEDRDALISALARSETARFSHQDIGHLLGVSSKTVSRRVSDSLSEVEYV